MSVVKVDTCPKWLVGIQAVLIVKCLKYHSLLHAVNSWFYISSPDLSLNFRLIQWLCDISTWKSNRHCKIYVPVTNPLIFLHNMPPPQSCPSLPGAAPSFQLLRIDHRLPSACDNPNPTHHIFGSTFKTHSESDHGVPSPRLLPQCKSLMTVTAS